MGRTIAMAAIVGVWGLMVAVAPSEAATATPGCGQALRIVDGDKVASPAFLSRGGFVSPRRAPETPTRCSR